MSRHFLVRLYADKHSVEEVDSLDAQIAAMEKETGGGRLLVLGGCTNEGLVFGNRFPNHRAGSPMPGLLLVVAAVTAIAEAKLEEGEEKFVSGELLMPEATFVEDSTGLLDKLNAIELEDAHAFVFLGNGNTFSRSFGKRLTLTQSESSIGADGVGDLLAGLPDNVPLDAATAQLGTDGAEIDLVESTESNAADADASPATASSDDPAPSDASAASDAQAPAANAQDAATADQATTRKGRASKANTAKEG